MSLIDKLTAQRDEQRQQLAGELRVARSSGREALLPSERAALDQWAALDAHIEEVRSEEARKGNHPTTGPLATGAPAAASDGVNHAP